MNKLLLFLGFALSINLSLAQNNQPNNTAKYAPNVVSKNMDWYQITFDVDLDDDTLNTELINKIDFNTLEQQRQENQDIEIEVEIEGKEITIILFSYQKCALNKQGTNNNTENK